MHKLLAGTLALVLFAGMTSPAFAGVSYPEEILLTGTVRDFCDPDITDTCIDHPDFEDALILPDTGIVESTLGLDGKPVYAGPTGNPTTTNATNFNQWYNDAAGVNSSGDCTIALSKISDFPLSYRFQDSSFFPIDESGTECESGSHFGNQGRNHNFHFTYELNSSFVYQGGEKFSITANDDAFVFINDQLVIDLGGIHSSQTGAVDLDTLGLVEGNNYPFDLFFAERHTTSSNFSFTTSILFDHPPVVVEDNGDGGDNAWDTRPTFGVNHETRANTMVDSGFTFNDNSFSITDNHHTPFDQQTVEIGAVNSFAATVWADKDLKVQEFLFGVPQVGMGHLAEVRVEVWYDFTGEIEDIIIHQESETIDLTSLEVSHQKSKCLESDTEAKCDTTFMSAVFLEPLQDNVMAIKAIDFKLRDQTTYLNDGFDISGDSLNPMQTKFIPSPTKGEGLIEVSQNEKYSDYWSTKDGRIFEMNGFGSFKQINQSFERFQDSGNPFNREHSAFGEVITYEQNRALEIFNSAKLISELPDSFGYSMDVKERLNEGMKKEMLLQEEIAKDLFDKIYNLNRYY